MKSILQIKNKLTIIFLLTFLSSISFSQIDTNRNGGIFEIFDWDGNITWNYKYSSEKYCQHHDMKILPNGNILLELILTKNYIKLL